MSDKRKQKNTRAATTKTSVVEIVSQEMDRIHKNTVKVKRKQRMLIFYVCITGCFVSSIKTMK